MSNPFIQDGGWDPFGELVSKPQQQAAAGGLKPARAAPPPPRPAATINPFSQLAPAVPNLSSAAVDDPFGLLSAVNSSTTAAAAPAAPPPPSYDSVVAASGKAAPPSYNSALDLPPPPPPSYDEAMGWGKQQQQQQQQPTVLVPARAAPRSPAAGQGPLHAGMLSRPAPARPAPAASGAAAAAAAAVPARPAPPAPMPVRAPPPAPSAAAAVAAGAAGGLTNPEDLGWFSSAVAAAPAGGKAAQQLQQQLAAVHVSAGSAASNERSSSSLSSSYASIGSIGAVPKAGWCNSQQALQRELSAQIRLPPLNPKTAAPLKTLAAGLGSLFAAPGGDAGQILQWSPKESGTTLPAGSKPCSREDHDSGACAELAPRPQDFGYGLPGGSSSKASRVTAMLLGHGPGLLWCGTSDGVVHCWGVAKDGTAGAAAQWLHSWVAHSGKKIKALALAPSGRLFTGAANGAIKMWNCSGPGFRDSAAAPRPLRQLRKLDARTGVSLDPHSKVVGLAVSAGGRVLWSVGKSSISLWSTHNGEHLGTIATDSQLLQLQQHQQQYYSGYAAMGAAGTVDINPITGLNCTRLDTLFDRPLPEVLAAEDDALDGEKDAATIAINAAVKGMDKASKLLNKLGTRLAARMKDEGRAGSITMDVEGSRAVSAAMGASGSASSVGSDAAAGAAPKAFGSIKKLVAALDGSIWLGYKRGLLEKYSEGGQLLWSNASSLSSSSSAAGAAAGAAAFRPAGITALAAVGSSVWVGDNQGQVWVLDAASAALQRTWKAHIFPVRSIAAGGHLVYSLGKAGSIRAWQAQPVPAALTAAWQQDLSQCLQEQQLQVLVGTWNVNETKPSRAGLQMWLADRVRTAHLVMVGLQEVEMGTGSVALDVVYQNLAKGRLEAGTQAAQAWATAVGEVLRSQGDFKRVGLRQMSGVLVLVYARAELEPHIGEVATASVACGVMGYGGNKGGVAVSFTLFRRRVVVVSSHFAAHQEKVESRNADYAKIVRHLHFHNVPTDKPQQQQQYEASDVTVLGTTTEPYSSGAADFSRPGGGSPGMSPRKTPRGAAGSSANAAGAAAAGGEVVLGTAGVLEEEWGAGIRDAELLVWAGDFNYRVDQPAGFEPDLSDPEKSPVNDQLYKFVHCKISAGQHLELLSGDQCIREMAKGTIFHTLAEGPISFLPTYKFEKGCQSNALQPFYDQGEKKRVPAWTDRVFFRGSGPQQNALQPNPVQQKSDVRVALASRQSYNSLMEVNDSDHKPVYAVLVLQLPWYQQQQQRAVSLSRLWEAASNSHTSSYVDSSGTGAVSPLVEPQQLMLQSSYVSSSLQISNPSRVASCLFAVQGSGQNGAIPTWLEVVPAAGVIEAGGSMRVRVQGTKAQWLAGGTRCELRVLGCMEGSVDSSRWPLASYGHGQVVPVVLP